MVVSKGLKAGTRVRLRSVSHEIELAADTGTIVRPDEFDHYYVIRLDEPAIYRPLPDRRETVSEIVEADDNFDVLANAS